MVNSPKKDINSPKKTGKQDWIWTKSLNEDTKVKVSSLLANNAKNKVIDLLSKSRIIFIRHGLSLDEENHLNSWWVTSTIAQSANSWLSKTWREQVLDTAIELQRLWINLANAVIHYSDDTVRVNETVEILKNVLWKNIKIEKTDFLQSPTKYIDPDGNVLPKYWIERLLSDSEVFVSNLKLIEDIQSRVKAWEKGIRYHILVGHKSNKTWIKEWITNVREVVKQDFSIRHWQAIEFDLGKDWKHVKNDWETPLLTVNTDNYKRVLESLKKYNDSIWVANPINGYNSIKIFQDFLEQSNCLLPWWYLENLRKGRYSRIDILRFQDYINVMLTNGIIDLDLMFQCSESPELSETIVRILINKGKLNVISKHLNRDLQTSELLLITKALYKIKYSDKSWMISWVKLLLKSEINHEIIGISEEDFKLIKDESDMIKGVIKMTDENLESVLDKKSLDEDIKTNWKTITRETYYLKKEKDEDGKPYDKKVRFLLEDCLNNKGQDLTYILSWNVWEWKSTHLAQFATKLKKDSDKLPIFFDSAFWNNSADWDEIFENGRPDRNVELQAEIWKLADELWYNAIEPLLAMLVWSWTHCISWWNNIQKSALSSNFGLKIIEIWKTLLLLSKYQGDKEIVLFFDWIDEINPLIKESVKSLLTIWWAWLRFGAWWNKMSVIASSRKSEFNEWSTSWLYVNLHFEDIKEEEINEYVLAKLSKATDDKAKIDERLKKIEEFRSKRIIDEELARSPLILYLICMLANNDELDTEISNRSQLYDRITELLFIKHNSKKLWIQSSMLKDDFKRDKKILSEIAFNKSVFNRNLNKSEALSDATIWKLWVIFKRIDNANYEFIHRSFFEYFTAMHLSINTEISEILSINNSKDWLKWKWQREILQYYCEILYNQNRLDELNTFLWKNWLLEWDDIFWNNHFFWLSIIMSLPNDKIDSNVTDTYIKFIEDMSDEKFESNYLDIKKAIYRSRHYSPINKAIIIKLVSKYLSQLEVHRLRWTCSLDVRMEDWILHEFNYMDKDDKFSLIQALLLASKLDNGNSFKNLYTRITSENYRLYSSTNLNNTEYLDKADEKRIKKWWLDYLINTEKWRLSSLEYKKQMVLDWDEEYIGEVIKHALRSRWYDYIEKIVEKYPKYKEIISKAILAKYEEYSESSHFKKESLELLMLYCNINDSKSIPLSLFNKDWEEIFADYIEEIVSKYLSNDFNIDKKEYKEFHSIIISINKNSSLMSKTIDELRSRNKRETIVYLLKLVLINPWKYLDHFELQQLIKNSSANELAGNILPSANLDTYFIEKIIEEMALTWNTKYIEGMTKFAMTMNESMKDFCEEIADKLFKSKKLKTAARIYIQLQKSEYKETINEKLKHTLKTLANNCTSEDDYVLNNNLLDLIDIYKESWLTQTDIFLNAIIKIIHYKDNVRFGSEIIKELIQLNINEINSVLENNISLIIKNEDPTAFETYCAWVIESWFSNFIEILQEKINQLILDEKFDFLTSWFILWNIDHLVISPEAIAILSRYLSNEANHKNNNVITIIKYLKNSKYKFEATNA